MQLGFSADASATTRFAASRPSKINVNLEVLPLFLAAAAQGDFLFVRALYANASTNDEVAAAIQKVLSDSAPVADALSLSSVKHSFETPVLSDALYLGVAKPLLHAASTADSPLLGTHKSPPTDEFSTADALRLDITRTLLSSFSATDDLDGQASPLDDQTLQFVKTLTHLASTADSCYNALTKYPGDTAGAADEGTLRNQGYADFSYFENDFVGAARTF
jgi:hypothetical protein